MSIEKKSGLSWSNSVAIVAIGGLLIAASELGILKEHTLAIELLKHVGMAMIVAFFLAWFISIREIHEHLTEYASDILVRDAYLDKLQDTPLFQLRNRITDVILRRSVQNKEYEYRSIEAHLEKILFGAFKKTGPTKGIASYREDFSERVHLEFMSGEELFRKTRSRAVGCEEAPAEISSRLFVKITTTTSYRVVYSVDTRGPHLVKVEGSLATIPFISVDQQVACELGSLKERHPVTFAASRPEAPKTTKSFSVASLSARGAKSVFGARRPSAAEQCWRVRQEGTVDYMVNKSVNCQNGTAEVSVMVTEVEAADEQPFSLSTMLVLTKTPEISITSNVPMSLIQLWTMGIGNETPRVADDNSIRMKYDGWLAPDHAYLIYWSPAGILKTLNARHAAASSRARTSSTRP